MIAKSKLTICVVCQNPFFRSFAICIFCESILLSHPLKLVKRQIAQTKQHKQKMMISQINDILDVFPLVKRVADKWVDF